jgi:hypothetical protein
MENLAQDAVFGSLPGWDSRKTPPLSVALTIRRRSKSDMNNVFYIIGVVVVVVVILKLVGLW